MIFLSALEAQSSQSIWEAVQRQSDRIHELDKKTSVIENHFEILELKIDTSFEKVSKVETTVNEIALSLAGQNGVVPKMEKHIEQLMERISAQEKKYESVGIKTKLLWGLFSSLLTGVILLLVKVTLGG